MQNFITYNLITEPWIGIKTEAEGVQKAGLQEVLIHAHEIVDIQAPVFFQKADSLYQYLALRLLAGIVSDIFFEESDDRSELFQQGQFDREKIISYFDKYRGRFDLFDSEHPFFQSSDADLKQWAEAGVKEEKLAPSIDNLLKANPNMPAVSGRIYGSSFDSPKYYELSAKERLDMILADRPTTFEELTYILLHANCTISGSGQGYTDGICGKAMIFETLMGNNLFETLVLNAMPGTIGKTGRRSKKDIPLWRCDGILDAFSRRPSAKEPLQGLFYPARIIRAVPNNSGTVQSMIYWNLASAIREDGKAYTETVYEVMGTWSLNGEPHGIHRNMDFGEPKKESKSKHNYVNLKDTDRPWLLLSGSMQTQKYKYQEQLELCQESDNLIPAENTCSVESWIQTDVGIRVFYRVLDSKSGIVRQAGIVTGCCPEKVMHDAEKQRVITKMLDMYHRIMTNARVGDEAQRVVSSRLEQKFGFLTNKGYIREIAEAESSEELDARYKRIAKEMILITQSAMEACISSKNPIEKAKRIADVKKNLYRKGSLSTNGTERKKQVGNPE